MQTLEATINHFDGVVIDPKALPADGPAFRQQLARSLQTWQADGRKMVWLEIPIDRAALIPLAVEAGFGFHHSGQDYLMLTYRLQPDAFIPAHATHYIGAGGVVINQREELLVVSERHRRNRDRPYYKLPGGALQQGEHLVDGVIREVLEETGVRARFEYLVCFRHWHGYRFGKSDIYFICRLAPLSEVIVRQDEEIEECFWMPVQDYLGNEYVGHFNQQIVRAALAGPGIQPTVIDGYGNPETHEFFMPPNLRSFEYKPSPNGSVAK